LGNLAKCNINIPNHGMMFAFSIQLDGIAHYIITASAVFGHSVANPDLEQRTFVRDGKLLGQVGAGIDPSGV
jgi:hypothetical protein